MQAAQQTFGAERNKDLLIIRLRKCWGGGYGEIPKSVQTDEGIAFEVRPWIDVPRTALIGFLSKCLAFGGVELYESFFLFHEISLRAEQTGVCRKIEYVLQSGFNER